MCERLRAGYETLLHSVSLSLLVGQGRKNAASSRTPNEALATDKEWQALVNGLTTAQEAARRAQVAIMLESDQERADLVQRCYHEAFRAYWDLVNAVGSSEGELDLTRAGEFEIALQHAFSAVRQAAREHLTELDQPL